MDRPRNTSETIQCTKNAGKVEKMKRIKTGFMFLPFCCIGLSMELYGPVMHDLKTQTRSSYESVAMALSGRGFGFFAGSLVGGMLIDKLDLSCDLLNAISLDIMATVSAIVPWIRSIPPLAVLSFVHGCSEGALSIGLARIILKLWKTKASSPLNAAQMGIGLGSCLVSVLANAFVGIPTPRRPVVMDNTTLTMTEYNQSDPQIPNNFTAPYQTDVYNEIGPERPSEYIREPRIEYAFLITASVSVIVSIASYVFYFLDRRMATKIRRMSLTKPPPPPNRSFRTIFNPATCAGGRFWYGSRLLALLFFYYFNVWGGLRFCGQMLRVFSIDQLNFTPSQGSYVNAAFWMSFTVGRVIAAILTNKIPIRIFLLMQGAAYLLATTLMDIFAHHVSFSLWILAPFLGLSVAPLYPSGLGWANYHMEASGLVITLIMFGGSVGGVALMCLVGYLYDHHGPRSFLYQLQGSGIVIFLVIVSLHIVGGKYGRRQEVPLELDIEPEEEEKQCMDSKPTEKSNDCSTTPMIGSNGHLVES